MLSGAREHLRVLARVLRARAWVLATCRASLVPRDDQLLSAMTLQEPVADLGAAPKAQRAQLSGGVDEVPEPVVRRGSAEG